MRQIFEDSTQKILKELSEFIYEYTNFGLEIWTDRLNNNVNDVLDLPANVLFRQVLEMSDAISELVKAGCINASQSLIRSSLDCYLQLAYLLKSDEKNKAMFFHYHYNLKKYNKLTRMINPEKENSFDKKLKSDKVLQGFELDTEETEFAKRDLEKLAKTLKSDANKPIAEMYGEKQRKAWYELLLKHHAIDRLAEELEETGLYEIFYRDLSEFSHGSDILHTNMKLIAEDKWGLVALRDVSNIKNVVDITILILERSILKFLIAKIPDKDKFKLKGFELVQRAQTLREHNYVFDEQGSLKN
jgi:Family of unknown function (DUF5677)